MTTATETLRIIEISAERALVQELRILIRNVQALRPALGRDDREYADGLLLKLDRLVHDQLVESVHSAGTPNALASVPNGTPRSALPEQRAAA
jgi:hypothetical protein